MGKINILIVDDIKDNIYSLRQLLKIISTLIVMKLLVL